VITQKIATRVGHVTRIGERKVCALFWWEIPKKKHFWDLFKLEYNIKVDPRDIGQNCVYWIYMLQSRGQLRKPLNDLMKLHSKRRIPSLPEIILVEWCQVCIGLWVDDDVYALSTTFMVGAEISSETPVTNYHWTRPRLLGDSYSSSC
jgi:hypothetical protein